MKRERVTHAKFSLLVIIVTIIIFIIGIIGTSGIKKMNQTVQSIYTDGLLPLQYLTQIRFAYVSEVLNASDEIKEHAMPYATAKTKLALAQHIIDSNWALFVVTVVTKDEIALLTKTSEKKKAADKLVVNLIKKIGVGDTLSISEGECEKINSAVTALIVNINQLDQFQIESSNESKKQNEKLYNKYEREFYFLIAVSVFFIAILGFYILEDISRFISDLKNSNLKLKESEEKYRYLFKNNPAHIIIWDLETLMILEVNESIINKYGYTREEWSRMSVLDYRPEKERAGLKGFAQKMLKEDTPIAKSVWTHLKKNGEEMLMDIYSHKIVYHDRPAILSLALDITEQEKAKEALRKTEEKFRSLVDHAADAIVIGSPIITEVNKRACEILQYTKEELIGMNILDLYPIEEQGNFNLIWENLQKGKDYKDERHLVRKDGTWILVEINRRMLPDMSGAIGIVRDITDRKKIENALRDSEERYKALIENINDGIVLLDDKGGIMYQSPSVEKIVGWTLEERKLQNALDFIHPDDIDMCIALFNYANNKPGLPIKSQYRTRHKDGHYLWLELFMTNLLANESINAYVVSYRDITERKRFEEQQLLMGSIINSSDDAIVSTTLAGIITSWNYGAEKILGHKAADVVGKHISVIVPPDLLDEECGILQKISEGKSIDHYETKRVKKEGELIDASLRSCLKTINHNPYCRQMHHCHRRVI